MDRLHPAFRRNHKSAPEGLLETTSRAGGDDFRPKFVFKHILRCFNTPLHKGLYK